MDLNCTICDKYLGELSKGKIHKRAVLLCEDCMEEYKTYESIAHYKEGPNIKTESNSNDLDAFKNIFGDVFNRK